MTPLLTRIDQELSTCTDPLRRAELLADRACYLARTGDFEGANAIASSLRRDYGDGRNARISVWIMLVEGLVLFFEALSSSARDRIFRANVLSKAMQLPRLAALTGVWLAHIEFDRSAYDSMARALSDSIKSADGHCHDVQSRAGLVLGDAYLYLGDRDLSQVWYEHARRHATEIGDRAAIGALMYNRAAFGLASIRIGHHVHNQIADEQYLKFIEMELESAWSFQVGTRVTSLAHLIDLCRARIAIVQRRFVAAVNILERLHMDLHRWEDRPNRPSVLVDLVWCLLMVGRRDDAIGLHAELASYNYKLLDIDDQVVFMSTLMKINEFLSLTDSLDANRADLAVIKTSYLEETVRLRDALGRIGLEAHAVGQNTLKGDRLDPRA